MVRYFGPLISAIGGIIMNGQNTDNYINIEEAAAYLGVKSSTIRAWIKKKNMPSHRVGGKLLKFKRSEIDEWVVSEKEQCD